MKLKGHKILFLLGLLVLSAVSSGFSQQYNFLKYTVADGLPHPQVLCSYQDKAGYMWIGTQGGLCRFDGTEFELFVDSSGALGNEVSAIAEGTDGIYIASERGVVLYKKGIFNPIKHSAAARFTKVYSFTWVSKMLILATDNGLFKVDGQQVIKVYTGSVIDKLVIRTLLFDSSNKLWVGTDRNGLVVFNYVNGVLVEDQISELQKLSQFKIRALIEISDGDVMVGTSGNGFYSFDGNIVNQVKLPNFLEVNYVTSGVKDANGIAWFGTWGEGLVSYHNGVFKNYNRNNGLFDDVILAVSVDSRGNVWMGSLNSSLIMYYGDTFTRLTKDDGLPSNEVRGIVEDDDANIWMATLNGVAMYDGVDVKVFDEKDGIQYPRIGAICTDGKTIYAGTMDGVLIEIANEKVRTYRSEGGVEPGEIISLMYTNDNSVWIGTVRKGLFLFTNGKIQQVESGVALLNNPIWSLYEGANGVIWLGTEKGLYKMENGSAISPVVVGNKSILTEAIYDIDGDVNYIYFASKSKGLGRFHLNNKKIEVLDKTEGLGSVYTEGVVRNGKNGFYVLTVLGLDEVILANDTQYVRHYYFREGIGTTKFSTGAVYLNEYGTLYMGSSDGVIIYRAPKMERLKFIKNIQIKSILLNNYEVNWSLFTDSISSTGIPFNLALPWNKNNLTFKIAGLEFGAGVQLQFQYRLLGRDSSWLSSNGSSIIALNNLNPGDYVLQVRALSTTNYGANQIEYYFTIQQPFWSTWWFFLCTVVVVGFVVLIILNYYRRSKISFVEQHVTSYNLQLVVSRVMLLLGGTLYPFSGWLCSVFEGSLNYQSSVQLLLGGTMIVTGILSYSVPYVKKHIQLFSHLLYSAIVAHTFYLCHINHLEPVLVITLMVLLSAAALILDNNKSAIIFVAAVLVSTFLLIILAGANTGYNRYLLLLAAIIHLIIVFISVSSRYNMFNRLIFADITINNSRSLIIAANRYGKIIFASRSFESVLGYRDEDLLGDGWWKIRTKEEEENKRMLDKVLQSTSISATYVSAITARDGTKKYVQWVDTEIIDGIKVGIGQDITDRYELEARYQHIVEAATDIIFTTDDKGCFTFLNEVATKISGYKMEDLIGKHFSEIIHPDWKKEVIGHYQKQFERKQVNTYLEFVMIGAEGQKIWIGQTVRLLMDASKPFGISGFQAIARDITEKKNYEEELEKLSLVASETINGVLICDPEGLIEWVNEGFTRITGFELQEVKGRLPGDVMAGERTNNDAIRKVRNLSSSAEGFHEEFLVYHKDGHEIWIDVSGTPIVDERGRILKHIEIFTDTTEKKRFQMQLNAYSVRLETLNLAKQQLLHSHTIQDIASNVLGALVQRLPDLRRASLVLLDENTKTISIQYVLKDAEHNSSNVEVPFDIFGSLPALLKNNYVIEGDLPGKAHKSRSDEENISVGINSYLVMPLYSQNKLLGSINFGSGIVNGITDEMVDMVREVADAIAAAVAQINYLNIIEQKNENIQSSILYARRIQNAILPPEEYLQERFADIFVFYQPKDVLSGDFYWVERRGKYTYLGVIDSTGHGVPGSLLSLMGHNLLNQAVHERGLISPAAILDYLNIGIQHTLNQYKGAHELRDGMDVALCVFEDGSNVVQFAGAINPLYVVRDGMLIQSKGNKFSIGSYFDNKFRPFTNQECDLQGGDVLYMFSDGYADQFGGDSDRKMSQRVFRKILLDIHNLPLAEQKEELLRRLREWQGNAPQTDDICIIGIKIS
jgi:PAS domain S-box-containing protein